MAYLEVGSYVEPLRERQIRQINNKKFIVTTMRQYQLVLKKNRSFKVASRPLTSGVAYA
jgi:hypothetical protein